MARTVKLMPPLSDEDVLTLRAGDKVFITGVIYTARDAAHKRLIDLLEKGEELPFDIQGAIIYYVGPAPRKPGQAMNSAGPTTSYRMDPYSPPLIQAGLKGMIGKGERGEEVVKAMRKYKAVYLAATGGAAALIAKSIKEAEVIAYPELGAEAIRRLRVENFPCIVAQDPHGNNLYKLGKERYRKV
ncbi:Fe-S-containing hydro-lyase [Methanosarcinales archaeon]|nr:MAG: Fe-S-containing hydro-lyase [Methanosarcinales archaeon]